MLKNAIIFSLALNLSGAAWAQTQVPGHALDANPQVDNWGTPIRINNPVYQPDYSSHVRVGAYQCSNRWCSDYQTYPLDRGSYYINGYGPFPNGRGQLPSRYSWELRAPLYPTDNYSGNYLNPRIPEVYAPVYRARPSTPARRSGSSVPAGPDRRLPSGRISPIPVSSGPIDARVGSTPVARPGVVHRPSPVAALYNVVGGELRCAGTRAEFVANIVSHTELSNAELRLENNSIRANRLRGERGAFAEGENLPRRDYTLGADNAGRCGSYNVNLPGGLRRDVGFKAELTASECEDAEVGETLDCRVVFAN